MLDVRAFGAKGDGTTDDTAAIQSAFNNAPIHGRVLIPSGVVFLVGYLTLPNGIFVHLDGTLKLKAGANTCVLGSLNAPQNVLIEGCGTIDGNASQQTGGFSQGFIADQASNVQIRSITITNTRNAGWAFTRSTNCLVEGVTVLGQGNTSGFAVQSAGCWAIGCTVRNTNDYGLGLYGNVHGCGITGCDVSGSASPAICVLSDDAQGGACSDVLITNNVLHDNPGGAIGIQYNPTPPATIVTAGTQHTNIIVTGNRGFNNCQGASGLNVTGVYLTSGQDVLVADNHFGPDGSKKTATCIAVVGGIHSINTVVQNNLITDQGLTAGNGSVGIFADGADTNTTIRGNVILDTRSTPLMSSAIYVATAGTGCVVENNTAHGIASPFNVDPALGQVRQSGLRWSFNGAVQLPTITASTSYANDAAAAAGGVAVGQIYRNGSSVVVRVD